MLAKVADFHKSVANVKQKHVVYHIFIVCSYGWGKNVILCISKHRRHHRLIFSLFAFTSRIILFEHIMAQVSYHFRSKKLSIQRFQLCEKSV